MKKRFAFAIFAVVLVTASATGGAQEESKPEISKDPLTAEQVAVYRAVLEMWVEKDAGAALNIASVTEPLDEKPWSDDKRCIRWFGVHRPANRNVVHRLPAEVALGPKMVMVDPEKHKEVVEKNDPGHEVDKALHGETVTETQIADAVDRAFSSGLFSSSEIAFSKSHRYALVQFVFVCGGLCGHGGTLVMEKSAGRWRVRKPCGGWVS